MKTGLETTIIKFTLLGDNSAWGEGKTHIQRDFENLCGRTIRGFNFETIFDDDEHGNYVRLILSRDQLPKMFKENQQPKMNIETLDGVLNEIADRAGVYGSCKMNGDCEYMGTFCCRVGFMIEYETRIRKAIENEQQLLKAGF